MKSNSGGRFHLAGLTLAALGVVYGDIGTSPLYALRECFDGPHALQASPGNILGILSLFVWSLILIVAVKYIGLVMQADNKGEGGILALLALAFPETESASGRKTLTQLMVGLGLFGGALLYGDGMITPAVSVLGAMEGLNIIEPRLEAWIVPLSAVILTLLFSAQRAGTAKVGNVFGPIMIVWFLTISVLGIRGIAGQPQVLHALSPLHGLRFLREGGWHVFPVLGSVFLVVTGGEALYADMGHFGRRPIRVAWFAMVLPALVLNYLGQGALLLQDAALANNPFYHLAPKWMTAPLVALATAAAVIASQALISGAFSLTMQGIQLGYIPRLRIEHTSEHERGQVYLPQVNLALAVACLGLVFGFRTSSNLAAAYGIAVTLTMGITTLLFFFASQRLWQWSRPQALLVCVPALFIELAFFGANALKIAHGGWFPLAIGLGLFVLMTTWKRGREVLRQRLAATSIPTEMFIEGIQKRQVRRVDGTAVYMASSAEGTPMALLHNLKHNKVLHRRVVFLTIQVVEAARVPDEDRVQVEPLSDGFWRIQAKFGFFESPSVPRILELCGQHGIEFRMMETTFLLSRETVIPARRMKMALWRERIFAILTRNAQSATTFFRIPASRVVELGMQVEI